MYFSILFRQLPYITVFLLLIIVLKSSMYRTLVNAGLFIFLAVQSVRGIYATPLMTDQYTMIILIAWVTLYVMYLCVLPYLWIHTKNIADFLVMLFPITFLITAHAAYLTHHIVGSSYGLWPLYVVMAGITVPRLNKLLPRLYVTPIIGLSCGLLLYILFMDYRSTKMFAYVNLEGAVHQSRSPRLFGAGTPGIWMPEFDRLVSYVTTNIPQKDRIITVPGEDPFYAVTGRRNPTPILMLKTNMYPIVGVDFPKYFAEKNVKWVIAKGEPQMSWTGGFIDLRNPGSGLTRYYEEFSQVGIYTIYQRNSSPV